MEIVVGTLVEVKGQEDGRLWEVLAVGTRRGENVAAVRCAYRYAETELEGDEDELVEVPDLDVTTLPVALLHAGSGYGLEAGDGRHRRAGDPELVAALEPVYS